jgi:hypothetical protein
MFVRSLITEAKEKKDKEPKKKEAGLPKSSGKLVDLKKELAALKTMKDELQAAKFAEKSAETEVEFANLAKFAKELDKIKAGGVALEQSIDTQITALEDKISAEKNKIKEMMGLVPEAGQEKMVDEARFKKGTDIGKKGKGFEKIEKKAAKQYGSEEAGKKVAGAILKKVIKKESMIREGQFIRIKNDFTLDGKNFKKGELIRTAKEFHDIEAAAKSGKIQKSDFAIVVGNA